MPSRAGLAVPRTGKLFKESNTMRIVLSVRHKQCWVRPAPRSPRGGAGRGAGRDTRGAGRGGARNWR